MIKRTIEISQQPAYLSVRHEQLVIQPVDKTKQAATTIPCEDIGLVMIDHPRVSYSHQALATLLRHGAAVVICGSNHLPTGLMLPLSSHTESLWRVNSQIAASKPLKKRLWQQIVVAKIQRQAQNLPANSPARRYLDQLATEVRSGDTTNAEGLAARVYWSAWLDPTGCGSLASSTTAQAGSANLLPRAFRRDSDGMDSINVMLNYGYTVLRAAMGRALVSAGLFPALGLHHHNRSNAFALADDLMEPWRPLVDAKVRQIVRQGRGEGELHQHNKAALLSLLTHPVRDSKAGGCGPLMVALHRVTASLVRCLQGEASKLTLPHWQPQEMNEHHAD